MAYFLNATLAQMVRDEQKGSQSRSSSSRPQTKAGGTGGSRNRYAAPCIKCGRRVPAGEGSLEKNNGTWITSHLGGCP